MTRDTPIIEDDAAAYWVARMDSGDWSSEDEAALQRWLDADPRRHGQLARTQAIWIAVDPAGGGTATTDRSAPSFFRRRDVIAVFGGAIAASLTGTWFFNQPRSYETEFGEIRRVALADGSVATVNTASRIDVRLEKNTRMIRLDRGEAWFQVAKSPNRPFVVEAGSVTVKAIGTAFSVRRLDHGSEVLVTEGVVETWCGSAAGRRTLLHAGERAFISDGETIHRQTAMAGAINRSLAWRSGKIDLSGASLNSAIADFNRYNRRKLVLLDPRFGSERLDGVFRIDDVEGFARTVGKVLAVPVNTGNADDIEIG